jgi:hypothetical protein
MERRVRTAWLLRERYRRVAWLAAIVGGLAALTVIALMVEDLGSAAVLTSPSLLVGSALALASCVLLPRWAVGAIGRRHSRRHD